MGEDSETTINKIFRSKEQIVTQKIECTSKSGNSQETNETTEKNYSFSSNFHKSQSLSNSDSKYICDIPLIDHSTESFKDSIESVKKETFEENTGEESKKNKARIVIGVIAATVLIVAVIILVLMKKSKNCSSVFSEASMCDELETNSLLMEQLMKLLAICLSKMNQKMTYFQNIMIHTMK